jgi:hypothetical protein
MSSLRQIDAARRMAARRSQERAYHDVSSPSLGLRFGSLNMSFSPRFHRLLAWLALCVMVFGAAAPTISRTLATTSQVTWMEVCSTSGVKRVAVPGNSTAGQEKMPADGTHCGYCVLQQHAPTPPSATLNITLLVAVLVHPVFVIPDVTFAQTLALTAHRCRAPPGYPQFP